MQNPIFHSRSKHIDTSIVSGTQPLMPSYLQTEFSFSPNCWWGLNIFFASKALFQEGSQIEVNRSTDLFAALTNIFINYYIDLDTF